MFSTTISNCSELIYLYCTKYLCVISFNVCEVYILCSLTGNNCSEYVQSEDFALWRLPFQCEVTMTTSHPHITVDDLVKVVNAFDAQTGMFYL